jgi:hypothetical protein
MLNSVKLTDQWSAITAELPPDWSEVAVRLRPEQDADLGEVARLLGSVGGGRAGAEVALVVSRGEGTTGPQAAARAFGRLDDARVWCRLEQTDVARAPSTGEPDDATAPTSIADRWDVAVAELPRDWSDLLCLLRIESSTMLDRAALLCAPLNPARDGDAVAFTFRAARRAGYGTAPSMVRRCFERLDEEEIAGDVEVLRQLSETDRVGTQGPVWLVGGRSL